MKCRVQKSTISGELVCPPNKSYTHRAIFLASLAGSNSRVENVLFSDDTGATIRACKDFGAEVVRENSSIVVKAPIDTGGSVPGIDAANSGTTIRIAAGIAGLFSQEITLTGDESLQKRPMRPLLDALESIGARCSSENGMPPVKVAGKIRGGDVSIPGNLSSQFVSSLLICAPLTENGINLSIEGNLVSKPYLDATISTMREFGVSVNTLIPYKRYSVPPQPYRPGTFHVPIDFSSLALLLSAAALNGRGVSVIGTMGNLPQGDEVFIDILGQLGANVLIDDKKISVGVHEKLRGGKFDLSNSPDLLPALSVLALKASEPIEISNVGHARLKETDRISILHRELTKLGVGVREKEDGLVLEPPEKLRSAELDPEKDHRLFMAFCIAGMFVGDCTVKDRESVAVSYPGFIEEMGRAGAGISTAAP